MLRFAPETIEYGEVDPGKPVTAKLPITNISGAPITVEGIKGGCGCTPVTAPPKDPVAAAELAAEALPGTTLIDSTVRSLVLDRNVK